MRNSQSGTGRSCIPIRGQERIIDILGRARGDCIAIAGCAYRTLYRYPDQVEVHIIRRIAQTAFDEQPRRGPTVELAGDAASRMQQSLAGGRVGEVVDMPAPIPFLLRMQLDSTAIQLGLTGDHQWPIQGDGEGAGGGLPVVALDEGQVFCCPVAGRELHLPSQDSAAIDQVAA